jgi:hypothetical protein
MINYNTIVENIYAAHRASDKGRNDQYYSEEQVCQMIANELADLMLTALKVKDYALITWINSAASVENLVDLADELISLAVYDGEPEEVAFDALHYAGQLVVHQDKLKRLGIELDGQTFEFLKRNIKSLGDPAAFAYYAEIYQKDVESVIRNKRFHPFVLSNEHYANDLPSLYAIGALLDTHSGTVLDINNIPQSILCNPFFTGMSKAAFFTLDRSGIHEELNKWRQEVYDANPVLYAMETLASRRFEHFNFDYDDGESFNLSNVHDYSTGEFGSDTNKRLKAIVEAANVPIEYFTTPPEQQSVNTGLCLPFYQAVIDEISNASTVDRVQELLDSAWSSYFVSEDDLEPEQHGMQVRLFYQLSFVLQAYASQLNKLASETAPDNRIAFLDAFTQCYGNSSSDLIAIDHFNMSNVSKIASSLLNDFSSLSIEDKAVLDDFINKAPANVVFDTLERIHNADGMEMAMHCLHQRCMHGFDSSASLYPERLSEVMPKLYAKVEELKPGFAKQFDFLEAISELPIDHDLAIQDFHTRLNTEKLKSLDNFNDDNASNAKNKADMGFIGTELRI